MLTTIIFMVISVVVGLFAGKPFWQKGLLTVKESAEVGLAFYEATKEESEGGRNITDTEKARILAEIEDVKALWRS